MSRAEKLAEVRRLMKEGGASRDEALAKLKWSKAAYYAARKYKPKKTTKKAKRFFEQESYTPHNPLTVHRIPDGKGQMSLRVMGSPSQLADFMKALGGTHA